jgi:hypothetical protein
MAQQKGNQAGALKLIIAALIALAGVAVVALNWPGHLSYDSVVQLHDGRTGLYHTWHPPIMAWLLGFGDHFLAGAGLFIVLQTALLFASLVLIVLGARRLSWWIVPVCLCLIAVPQVLIWQGIVWKDVLFADSMVAGFVLLWRATRLEQAIPFWAVTACAFACLVVATLVRQNGFLALVVGAGALVQALYARSDASPRHRLFKAFAVSACVVLASLACVAGVGAALSRRSIDGNGARAQLNMLMTYDVVGVIARDPKVELDQLEPDTASRFRSAAKTDYTPRGNEPLLGNSFDRDSADDADDIKDQWFDFLRLHPLTWLGHRLSVFRWVISAPAGVCFSEQTGVDGPEAVLNALKMQPRQTPRDAVLEDYASRFHKTPLHSHLFLGGVAVLLAVVMFRSPERGNAVFSYMLVAALLFTASFFLIGVSCDYRYLYALDLATLVAGFHWLLDFEPQRRSVAGLDRTGAR